MRRTLSSISVFAMRNLLDVKASVTLSGSRPCRPASCIEVRCAFWCIGVSRLSPRHQVSVTAQAD